MANRTQAELFKRFFHKHEQKEEGKKKFIVEKGKLESRYGKLSDLEASEIMQQKESEKGIKKYKYLEKGKDTESQRRILEKMNRYNQTRSGRFSRGVTSAIQTLRQKGGVTRSLYTYKQPIRTIQSPEQQIRQQVIQQMRQQQQAKRNQQIMQQVKEEILFDNIFKCGDSMSNIVESEITTSNGHLQKVDGEIFNTERLTNYFSNLVF